MEKGCSSFAHWFSPVRGACAEKYDNFIDLNYKTMQPIVDFSGSKLLAGETDGSSFPNGGLRVTHTAGAYTAWDTSSVRERGRKRLFCLIAVGGWVLSSG